MIYFVVCHGPFFQSKTLIYEQVPINSNPLKGMLFWGGIALISCILFAFLYYVAGKMFKGFFTKMAMTLLMFSLFVVAIVIMEMMM